MKVYTCFPEGKFKVLTMSYDDGKTIACHTLTHPTIARCPLSEVIDKIAKDRINLEKIVKHPVTGLSYPNGSYSKEIENALPALGIKYSRIVGNSDNFELPTNLYEWKATCHHNHNLLEHGEEFCSLHKKQYLYMMYVWGHSYEFERDNNWEIMEKFCELVGKRDDIWYATNIEYVNYMEAAKRLTFAYDLSFVYNPSSIDVWLCVDSEKIINVKGGETKFF